MYSRTAIITGICGHLGNYLAKELLDCGFEVRGLVMRGEDSSHLDSAIRLVVGDVRDKESMRGLFEGLEGQAPVFVHAAAIISIRRSRRRELLSVNVGGTENVVELCREHGVSRLIYISSVDGVYCKGRGCTVEDVEGFYPEKLTTPYAVSKAAAANVVMNSGLEHTIILPSGIIGPGDYRKGLMSTVFSCYLSQKLRIGLRGGFDFIDVRDVAKAVARAAVIPEPSELYIVSNRYVEIPEMLNTLLRIAGKRRLAFSIGMGLAGLLAPLFGVFFRMMGEKNLLTRESVRLLGKRIRFSSALARSELGLAPRPLEETLSDTIAFIGSMRWTDRRLRCGCSIRV